MPVNYQSLLSVTITHSYFANKICKALHLQPSEASRKIMWDFGLIFKPAANGFSIFADKQGTENSLNEIMLQFEITCNDGNFFNYTDLADSKPGCLAYHSTNALNVDKDGITQLIRLPHAAANYLTVALSDLAEKIRDEVECQFEINFTARATQWRYFLVNKSNARYTDFRIGNEEIVFNEPVEVNLSTGEKALMFSSGDRLLQLSEYAHHHFSLTAKDPMGKINMKSRTIMQHLPGPSLATGNLLHGVSGAADPISDIVIYI